MATFDPEVLQLLVCPVTKAELVRHRDQLVSTDKATRRAYSIADGIPDMLIEHSRELSLDEWDQAMRERVK